MLSLCLAVAVAALCYVYFSKEDCTKKCVCNTVNNNQVTPSNETYTKANYVCLNKAVSTYEKLSADYFTDCNKESTEGLPMLKEDLEAFKSDVFYSYTNAESGVALAKDKLLFEEKLYTNGASMKLNSGTLSIKDGKLLLERDGQSKEIFSKEKVKFIAVYKFYDSTGTEDILVYTESKNLYIINLLYNLDIENPVQEKTLLTSVDIVKIISDSYDSYPGPSAAFYVDSNGNFKKI